MVFAPRAPYLVPLLLLVVCRAVMAARVHVLAEDAFITLRYAWNWAHGVGPVFNPGERVMGFTSAPWMAWLAAGLKLGADATAWARVSLGVLDAVTLLAFASLLERHASRAAAWCFGVFFAAWPFWSGLGATGLETGGALAWLALSAWLLDRRHAAAGGALGLLALWRPEGLLAALMLAFWASWRDRLVALALLAAGALVLTLGYGSPVPHSVLAKAAVYGAPGPLHAAQWWDWALPAPLSNGIAMTSEGANFFLLAILATPAAIAGARVLWGRRSSALAGAVAAAAVVWLAYIATGTSWFFWYFATPLFAWAALASAGLPEIVRGRLVYAAAAIAVLGHWSYETSLYAGRAAAEGGAFGAAGELIAAHARPGDEILLEPIGTIGFTCREQRILDEVGLVSPEVTALRRRGPGWYADLLAKRHPRWLVVRAGFLRTGGAFVGATAPFRSEAERTAALAPYAYATGMGPDTPDNALVILFIQNP